MGRILTAIVVAGMGLAAAPAGAALVTNVASADTSLIEIAPTNNNGAQAWVLAGRIQNDNYRNRGLYKFDFTNLPTNAVIRSATAVFQVTRVPAEAPANASFGLHRMLRPWGEGNKSAALGQPPGQGRPATAGEATWRCAFHPTNDWSIPGGAADVDFSGVESSFQFIGDLGTYYFDPTPELVADVQGWVNHPESNYGWMLLCNAEDTPWNARRFGSREDPEAFPTLEISFMVPPTFDRIEKLPGQFNLYFTQPPDQAYRVETRTGFGSGGWQTFATFPATGATNTIIVADTTAAPQKFFRLVSY